MFFTIGHSTRPIEVFLALLAANGVRTVADIRSAPSSRRSPQYAADALADSLALADIGYVHVPELGGRRRPRPDSPNGGWRNEAFRGYADYAQTPAFEAAVEDLLRLSAERGPVALLCAEAVPWRCHRSLVADAVLARGVAVSHLVGPGAPRPHRLTPFARVDGTRVTYPVSALALTGPLGDAPPT